MQVGILWFNPHYGINVALRDSCQERFLVVQALVACFRYILIHVIFMKYASQAQIIIDCAEEVMLMYF